MDSQWVYGVFWRILPRSYPPPKWDAENGIYDRSKGNKRNWILAWEDGFCDFSECARAAVESNTGPGLQPELFFKMSHEVYNFGEGLMGKVAADNSHKWIFRDPLEHEINFLSPWHNSIDPHPRTWGAQFKSGVQTIAVIAVREGLVQLGAIQKVIEDLNFVIHLQRKFNYLLAIPGVFLPHPSSSLQSKTAEIQAGSWQMQGPVGVESSSGTGRHLETCFSWNGTTSMMMDQNRHNPTEFMQQQMTAGAGHVLIDTLPQQLPVTPSMSSLQALLSKLPSVTPASRPTNYNNISSPDVVARSLSGPRQRYSSELTQTSMFMNPQQFQLPPPAAAPRSEDFIEEFHDDRTHTDGAAACTGMDSYLSEVVD